MQRRVLWTLFMQALATARLRLALVLGLTLMLWIGLFKVIYEGFSFLRSTLSAEVHDPLVLAVFSTFFITLMAMLVFSSSIILHGSLFRTSETAFLLTLPINDDQIFMHKFRQAVALSSWGFLLLATPLLTAYGLVDRAPWYYFAILLPMLVAFVYIPVGIGAILCLLVVYWLPRRRYHIALLAAAGVLCVALGLGWKVIAIPASELFTPGWFTMVLNRLQLTENKLLPNWWLTSGLREAAAGHWSEGVMYLVLMVANALMIRELAAWVASRVYRRAYSLAVQSRLQWNWLSFAWFDRLFSAAFSFLPRETRLMMLKDIRIFRRDPAQWLQFVILLVLLGLYFVNVRPFNSVLNVSNWVSVISFMNLAVVGLLMSTFTTRFIFPLISLEGRRFWLLGLLPLNRDTIVLSKFFFSLSCLLLPAALLVALSDHTLHVTSYIASEHQWASAAMALGLSGIAVGLGARLPNLREQSPSRIAAGFGGTLNLVLSTFYILCMLVLSTLPCHLYEAATLTRMTPWLNRWMAGGTGLSVLLAVVATLLPLRVGLQSFRRLEM